MDGFGVHAGADVAQVLGTENFTRSGNEADPSAQQAFKTAAYNPNEQSFQNIIKHEI
jgi:hypothetical protein